MDALLDPTCRYLFNWLNAELNNTNNITMFTFFNKMYLNINNFFLTLAVANTLLSCCYMTNLDARFDSFNID